MTEAIAKRVAYRNPRILELAKDMPCVSCSRHDGTTVAAHYQGIRAYLLGKGKTQKPDDDCIAFLCGGCHQEFDNYLGTRNEVEASERFLFCVVRSMNLLHRIGFDFQNGVAE